MTTVIINGAEYWTAVFSTSQGFDKLPQFVVEQIFDTGRIIARTAEPAVDYEQANTETRRPDDNSSKKPEGIFTREDFLAIVPQSDAVIEKRQPSKE